MHSLIGDRFLKRFLGYRSHQHRANPAGEEKPLPENAAAKTAEPGYPLKEDLPRIEATLEKNKTGDIMEFASSENGSDQPANDH
jgi:hypothetical protein